MAIRITTGVFRLNIADEMSVLAAGNFCSCARILIIPPPTNYNALIGEQRTQAKSRTDSVRCLLMSHILLFFADAEL